MKTRELLVRTVVAISPDGNSTSVHEHIEVEINWLGEKPADESSGYAINGTWRLSRRAAPKAEGEE